MPIWCLGFDSIKIKNQEKEDDISGERGRDHDEDNRHDIGEEIEEETK